MREWIAHLVCCGVITLIEVRKSQNWLVSQCVSDFGSKNDARKQERFIIKRNPWSLFAGSWKVVLAWRSGHLDRYLRWSMYDWLIYCGGLVQTIIVKTKQDNAKLLLQRFWALLSKLDEMKCLPDNKSRPIVVLNLVSNCGNARSVITPRVAYRRKTWIRKI